MIQVNFFIEDIKFTLKNKSNIRKRVTFVISKERPMSGVINFIFCNDAYLVEINKRYLKKDYFTDVISFESADNKGKLQSDVFISVERVKENARIYKCSMPQELERVIIHGTLHICGFEDNTSKRKQIMTKKEDFYLEKFPLHKNSKKAFHVEQK